jgi:hypothetical protein
LVSARSPKQEFTTTPLRLSEEPLQQLLFQIYPNPTEDHATIKFTLPQSSHVYIKAYDVNGKEFETLQDETMEAGSHSLLINTLYFSKGIYFIKMISDFGIENQKLIVQ